MIGIAALFACNGMQLTDGKKCVKIETNHGTIVLPKDYHSDALRLQEAIEEKCPAVKGLITIPKLKGDTVLGGLKTNWAFKDLWDKSVVRETDCIWGEDFQTYAEDHLNKDNEFGTIDIWTLEHYYNVCLSNVDVKTFMQKNPAFSVRDCDKECIDEPHKHAVHGVYKGAALSRDDTDLWTCAPPLRLHPVWEKVVMINPKGVQGHKDVNLTVAKGKIKIEKALGEFTEKEEVKKVEGEDVEWAGAHLLESFVKNPASTWTQVFVTFMNPRTAKWAVYPKSAKSIHLKNFRACNVLFINKILPMLEGEGSPLQTVLDTIWLADEGKQVVPCFLMRKLIECGSNIFSYEKDQKDWVSWCE